MRVHSALLLLLLTPLVAGAAPREAVLLFTGDNGGELADCGCRQNPAGGLARRKTLFTRERAQGRPVLVLDAGNALFKSPQSGAEPDAKARAELLLGQMEALGTAAMAVGARDLVLGADFLKQATRKAKLRLLSANLVDAQGQPLFPGSSVVTVEGMKFGLVGLSPEGAVVPGATGRPAGPAALAEARRLREKEKVDVVVVLAALPMAQAQALARETGGAVDFVVQSHEGRIPGVAQHAGAVTLLPSGERGRQVGRLELSLNGAGPFFDVAEVDRAREGLKLLDDTLVRTRERLAAAKDDATKRALEESLSGLLARQRELTAQAQARPDASARTQRLTFIPLGPDVAEDPEVKRRVEQLQPPGASAH